MILVIILLVLIILSLFLLFLMGRMYRNKIEIHKFKPSEYNIPFKEVRFPTKNNCSLYGWWIPSDGNLAETNQTVLLVHGWNRNLGRMMPYIRQLHGNGYNLFAFDARNHGSSDTDGLSSMPKFAEDIQSAMDYLFANLVKKENRLGIIGLSMGGSAAIYAASTDKRINRIITVGAFAHPAEVMRLEMKRRHIPEFPFIKLFLRYAEYKIGYRFSEIAPVNNIHKVDAKILLIHGKLDQTTPFEHAEKLLAVGKPENMELFPVFDKGHSDCHETEGFWDKIRLFLHLEM